MPAGDVSKSLLLELRYMLGDLNAATWSSTDLYSFLADGQQAVVRELRDAALYPLSKVTSATLTGGTASYALPSDFLREHVVKYKTLFATRTSLRDLELADDTMQDLTETTPYYYIWDGKIQFQVGTVTQAAAETYEVWYIASPTTISASVDPLVTTPYFNLLLDYAAHLAYVQNQQEVSAEMHLGFFTDACQVINAHYGGPEAWDEPPRDANP